MATTITRTIGTSSRDYSTLQAWEDAIPANLVTADEVWRGECYNDSEFTGGVTFSAHTTDATRFVVLTAAAGQSFQDHANVRTNALRYNQSNGVGVVNTGSYQSALVFSGAVDYVTISRLQVRMTHSASIAGVTTVSGCNHAVVKDLVVDAAGFYGLGELLGSVLCINVLAIIRRGDGHGFGLRSTSSCVGCTAVVPTDISSTGGNGFRALNYASSLLKSCATFGFSAPVGTVGVGAFSGSSSGNATNAASGLPGTGNQHSVTYSQTTPFTDADKDSLDLRSIAATALIGAGTYDGTNAPNDISAVVRANPPTIGHWELVAAGGGSLPLFLGARPRFFSRRRYV